MRFSGVNHNYTQQLITSFRAVLGWLPLAGACIVSLLVLPALASDLQDSGYRLFVKPSICVSYNSDEPCIMLMQVSWEGDNIANVCLRDAITTPVLYCWQDSREGSMTINHANSEDVLYQLVEETSLGVLAEAEIKVINRDLRSSRKRRRHVWSIL